MILAAWMEDEVVENRDGTNLWSEDSWRSGPPYMENREVKTQVNMGRVVRKGNSGGRCVSS